jgi:hypothetical protein
MIALPADRATTASLAEPETIIFLADAVMTSSLVEQVTTESEETAVTIQSWADPETIAFQADVVMISSQAEPEMTTSRATPVTIHSLVTIQHQKNCYADAVVRSEDNHSDQKEQNLILSSGINK